MVKKTLLMGMLAIVFVCASACTTQAPDSDAVAVAVEGTMTALASEATATPTATNSPTATATSTPTPAPTNTPTATPTPEPLPEFQRYTSQDAIEAFVTAGLEAESPTPLDPNEQSPVPKTYVEGKRFLIPSLGEDRGGRVFSFESENELNAIKNYYEGFTGFLGSWVFVKDNLVVQIGNDLPKAKADQYKQVLESLD